MTEMIPDQIPSHADDWTKKVFETFKHSAPTEFEDWVVFPSKPVPKRDDPSIQREVDFVILIEDILVVICLFSRPSVSLTEAKDIMEDLKSHFVDPNFLDDPPFTLMYAIVSEDKGVGSVKIEDGEGDESTRELDRLEELLVDYAIHKSEVVDRIVETPELEAKRVFRALKSELDPNNTPTVTIVEDYRQQFLDLTVDQYSGLQHVELNDRCVIDGAAGTGKTVLAQERAKRLCEGRENRTVGLLCSNRYLSEHFESWVETLPNDIHNSILVGTPATLPIKIFEAHGESALADQYRNQLKESPELEETLRAGYLDNGWEDFLETTVTDLEPIIDGGIFNYLIVDEAQNLCDPVFLNLMDALLIDGLAEGCWTMFGDFKNQTLVNLDRNTDGRNALADFGLYWCNDELKTNCRNTHEITDAVANLINIHSLPRSSVHGPHVEIKFFDSLCKLNEMLEDQVISWKNKGFNSKDIILLSSGTDNVFGDITEEVNGKYDGWELQPLNSNASSQDSIDSILRYSDIYDFQGLERNLVILVMPETEDQVTLAGNTVLRRAQHLDRILYTGMSRAHTILVIFAHGCYEDIIKDNWPNYPW